MTQTPSMEHHNKAPSPFQCMQFGNTKIAPAENTDNTIFFDDPADTPIFFDQPMLDFSNNHFSRQCSPPKCLHRCRNQLLGRVGCQELWQNQCHSRISTEKKRCTTWRHKPYASTTMAVYMTAISIFKIACVILSRFSQR